MNSNMPDSIAPFVWMFIFVISVVLVATTETSNEAFLYFLCVISAIAVIATAYKGRDG